MTTVSRDELVRRVRERLRENGTAEVVIEIVTKPGFFPSGDVGLATIARKLGVLTAGDVID